MKQILFRKKIATWLLCSFIANTVGVVYGVTSQSMVTMARSIVANNNSYVDVSPQNIAGMDLKQVMCDIVMRARDEGMLEELPKGVIRCYESLQTSMYVHRMDLEEAMPFIIRSVVPMEMLDENGNIVDRAMRPDAPQGSPIVGAATCDLTPVLKAISCLRALIIREFNETWTILANIEQELLECCSQIHAEFNATWTILNQIEVDLAECCSQIHQDFNATWTILANLDRDSSETWTMIQACCDEISQDFDGTWTVLANIEQELIECCSQNRVDFANTWTMIQACCDETQEDFNATWTMIQNCCNEISNDFNGTWTILAEFASAATVGFEIIVSAIEACCAQTQSSFRDTWTILDNIEQELIECCSQNRVDFANTWTMIQNCCDQTQEDFNATWTMIQNCCDEISRDFDGTWTILAHLQQDMSDCCTQTQRNFEQTWTMIQNCCNEISRDFQATWTILADMSPCGATPLFQSDVVAGILTIATPGTYCLAEDINGTIDVATDGVTIDLNGHTLAPTNALSYGVQVATHSDIIIKNGFIGDSTPGVSGGVFLVTCTNVQIEDVDFKDVPQGINATDVNLFTVNDVTLRNHTSNAMSLVGIYNAVFNNILVERCGGVSSFVTIALSSGSHNCRFENVSVSDGSANIAIWFMADIFDCTFINCWANRNTAPTVWSINSSQKLSFVNCQANNNIANNSATASPVLRFGIWSFSSSQNINLVTCQSNENSSTNTTGSPQLFAGFLLQRCKNTLFENCQANNNSSLGALGNIVLTAGFTSFNPTGFFSDTNNNISFRNCEASYNRTLGAAGLVAFGFDREDGDIIKYDHCFAHGNNSAQTQSAGFSARTFGINILYTGCAANENTGSSSGEGFNLDAQTTLSVLECLAQSNNGGGILISTSTQVIVQKNIVQSNVGTGINVAGIDASVFANEAQDNGINFNITGPIITYTQSSGLFSGGSIVVAPNLPTPYDNIDIVP